MKKNIFNSLYWRISAVFFLLLAVVGVSYVYITVRSSEKYFDEVNQQLNRNTAKNIVENSKMFYDGHVIKPALDELFHNVMVINPALEVYLIDTTGKIIAWYPPEKKIQLQAVNLTPVLKFVNSSNLESIKGDDPLNPETEKIFSASRLSMNGMLYAYIYVVLSSEEYTAVSKNLATNFFLKIGSQAMLLTLLATLLVGLLIIRIITNNLSRIIEVMQKFREGDLTARVQTESTGDVKQVAVIFNEMADILTENIEKLKAVEVLRRELVANVSHDLRTPIAIIQGYVETMQMKADTLTEAEKKRYLNIISESTSKLEKLILELFELSKLEANQVEAHKEPFFISELVNDISSKYQLVAKVKNITINTVLSKELPMVVADVSLIERVMQNLVDNAMKYTPEGGEIIIKTCKNENGVEVSVSDTGIGIPESEREQIFGRYYKANNFTDLKNSTGLGLAIVKKILDLHDSSLDLITKVNTGSSFIFRLPIYKSN